MDEQQFFDAPILTWLLIAALLGAVAMWIYYRCVVAENRAVAADALAERDEELARIGAEYDAHPLGRAPDDAGEASAAQSEAEVEALRYRVWALETRLHSVGDAIRDGAPIDAAMITEGLDEVNGDGAPPREVAALKFAAWRAERDEAAGREGPADGPEPAPVGAAAEPGVAAALAARADFLSRRLDRTLAAAKAGRLDELTAIEREAAAENGGSAARFGAAFEPFGDGEPSALRFRNWLLSASLTRVLEQARAGWRIDPDAIADEVEAAARGAAFTKLPSAPPRPEPAPAAASDPDVAELEETAEALADLNSGLRYRVWMLRRGLDPATGAALFAASAAGDAAADENAAARAAELDAARARILAMEAELARRAEAEAQRADLRADLGDAEIAGRAAMAETLRVRVDELEAEARRLVAERAAYGDALERAEWRAGAETDAARALRTRASQVEAALRGARPAEASAALLRRRVEGLEAQAARAASAAAAADARLWSNEQRMADLGLRLDVSEARAAESAADSAASTELERALLAARSDAATLRSRLWAAEWRHKRGAAALADALAQQAALRSALARPEDDPRVRAELDSLRARLAELEAADGGESAREAERRRREAETLRARLALVESEAERLRGQLAERGPARGMRDPTVLSPRMTAGAALAAARAEAVAKPDPFAARTRLAAPAETVARAQLRRALEPVRRTPLWGAESAALELIDTGAVVAITSNRPKCLRDLPDAGAPDDLTLIAHVTPKMAEAMQRVGLYYFHQFEECAPGDLAWIDDRLSLRGAVVRDRWAPQARELADWKRAGRLHIGDQGFWTVTSASFVEDAPRAVSRPVPSPIPAPAAATPHPIETYVPIDSPMSGAEYAMLDMIADPRFDAREAAKPTELRRPEDAPADDLTRIRGVDDKLAAALAAHNVTTYRRIAEMTPQSGAWLDLRLGLGGRIARDRWQPQARILEERRAAGRLRTAPSEPGLTVQPPPRPTPTLEPTPILEPTPMIEPAPQPVAPPPSVAPPIAAPAPAVEEPWGGSAAGVEAAESREAEAGRLVAAGAVRADDPAPEGLLAETPEAGADDLKLIQTIGPKLEARLNGLGVYSFEQLARFPAASLAWIDASLGLGGRIARENWARQAVELSERKAAGDMSIGGEGSWTLQNRGGALEDALHAARTSPYTDVEVEAMRLITGEADLTALPRPTGLLDAPSGASPDDLKMINGVGPQLERTLNELGVFYFAQIARFTAAELAWVDAQIKFKGRSVRDRWAPQAAALRDLRKRG